MSLITLLTDFGFADSYVAEVKGVLLSLAPGIQVVDIAHDIAPGNVRAAAYVLGRAWPRFPAGTVHLAVVDPGVGTTRRAIAVDTAGHRFVAPDNGLLSSLSLPAEAHVVSLQTPMGAAPTFHARDLFAPAAAALATGTAVGMLGPPITDVIRLPIPTPRILADRVVAGEVVHVDRFGTLITNLTPDLVPAGARIVVGGHAVTLGRTFADVAPGKLVAFAGSGGTMEIAARDARAATLTQLDIGATVRVEPV